MSTDRSLSFILPSLTPSGDDLSSRVRTKTEDDFTVTLAVEATFLPKGEISLGSGNKSHALEVTATITVAGHGQHVSAVLKTSLAEYLTRAIDVEEVIQKQLAMVRAAKSASDACAGGIRVELTSEIPVPNAAAELVEAQGEPQG